ncbi:MAG: hypothetical protein RLW61_23875 [Gammaproteobacteria bacterium]
MKTTRIFAAYGRTLVVLACALTCAIPLVASAATYVPFVDDLAVGDAVYDVNFVYGGFNTVFDADADRVFGDGDGSVITRAPTFWNDQAGAQAAALALMQYLGSDRYIGDYFGTLVDGFRVAWGAFAPTPGNVWIYTENQAVLATDSLILDTTNGTTWSGLSPWAVFTPVAAVPLPPAVLLLAPALGLLARRRARN